MSSFGIKVSKPGYSTNTTDITQQVFNSEKNTLKIVSEGTVTGTVNGVGTLTVAHNLGYVPAHFSWFQVNGNGNWYPNYTQEDFSGGSVAVKPFSGTTNFYIPITTANNATVSVSYLLFVDPGQ